MLIERGNARDMKGLLHLFSIPGADWSRILHRIYLETILDIELGGRADNLTLASFSHLTILRGV